MNSRSDGKRHDIEIDSTRTHKTPQDVEAILAGFDTIREIVERINDISITLNLPFEGNQYENCFSTRVIEQLRVELNSLEEERKKHMAVFIQDANVKLQVRKLCLV